MDNKWICLDCLKLHKCKYFKWVNLINGLFTNPNRVIVDCKHYERELSEK
jgi:hypothetical protein